MTTDWQFVICDALEKVYPDADPRPRADDVGLSVTLGEPASFQLAYRPPFDGSLRDPRPLHLDVVGDSADLVEVRRVDLVPCELPAFPGHDDGYDRDAPGLYPDVLVPLNGGELWPLFGSWRAVWLDLLVDDDSRTGIHTITIVVSDDEGRERFREDVVVRVLGVRLPELDIVNSHWLHVDAVADHYRVPVFSEAHWELLERFVESAAGMGVNSLLAPVWTPPLDTGIGHYRTPVQLVDVEETSAGEYRFGFGKLARWLELCRRNGVKGVEVAHLFTQWGAEFTPAIYARRDGETVRLFGWEVSATDPRYRRFLEQLLPALVNVLDDEVEPGKVVFHVSDEPHGRVQLENYLAAKSVVTDLLEGRRIVDALSDFAYYSSGAVPVPVVATDAIEPFLADRPDELWAYYCVSQERDVANRFFALPSARNRVLGHQLFAFGIDGFLHWGFNFYYSWHSLRLVDPFRDTTAGGAFPGGDPFVVYPGEDGHPLPSIRYRVFAQAMADHRAMQALRDRDGIEAVLELIDPDGGLRFDRFSVDPVHYLRVREAINARLVEG
ncbi:DUF4091 domain-containing protein [Humibacter sp. RRB41]|uniref:DUF4091 domain-containing protein n=1 Tax=Humibacter sp. RRB41 TaxID=2919946 RepID=UPI001FA9AC4F|nr:DUF4091 domain-containing protein [Humibacter sp. RRB41]